MGWSAVFVAQYNNALLRKVYTDDYQRFLV